MRYFLIFVFLLCGSSVVADVARADVYSALQSGYDTNPIIAQERQQVNLARAQLDSAKTNLQPYLGLTGNVGVAQTDIGGYSFDYVPMQYGLEVQQNVFQGGAMFAQIKAGYGMLSAANANLYAVQQDVFLGAINAYAEVLNAQAVLDLNKNNLRVLGEYYKFVDDGYNVGRLTKTDVAQAAARMEMAKYGLADAQANYDNAIETFRRIYGTTEDVYENIDLDMVQALFPESVHVAEEQALRNHPLLIALAEQEAAIKQNMAVAYSSWLPSIDVRGAIQRLDNMPILDDVTDSRIGVYLKVPLYDKGNALANSDKVRANVATVQEQIKNARRVVVENLRSAWNLYMAQKSAIVATQASIDANKMALDGIRDEQKRGRRTVLDVLNAEQELLNSRVAHTRAKYAQVSAFFAVLAAIGELTPENLDIKLDNK